MTTPTKKPAKKRAARKTAAEATVEKLVKMPLGDLARTAEQLVGRDLETAKFFARSLAAHLPGAGDESPVDDLFGE